MSSDLNCRSNELICWLTADCVTLLICAARVKLSVSAKSQNIFRLSICMPSREISKAYKGSQTARLKRYISARQIAVPARERMERVAPGQGRGLQSSSKTLMD